jgi:uncharacterized protein (DUF58 family)
VIPLRDRIIKYGRIGFLAFWAFLLFAIATNIQAGWLYVVIAFQLILGLISVVWPAATLRKLHAGVSLPELCERGSHQSATLFIENRSRFSKYLVRMELPESDGIFFDPPFLFAARLKPGARVAFMARFIPAVRGRARVKNIILSSGAPAGLFVKKRAVPTDAETLVYPKISAAEGETLAAGAGAEEAGRLEKQFALEDPYHYKIREYAPGESLRRIHWKLTAKLDQPMIRIHERKIFGHAGILVDNLRGGYPRGGEGRFEEALEKAASLAFHLVFTRGSSVTVAGTAAPEITIESGEHWEHALRWFALIRLEDSPARADYGRRSPEYEQFRFGPETD